MIHLLLLDYVVNAVWQTPIAAVTAWLICRFVPLRPETQSRVLQLFLALAVFAPLLPENHLAFALFDHWRPFAWRDPLSFGLELSHGSVVREQRPAPIWIVLDRSAEARVTLAFTAIVGFMSLRFALALQATARLVRAAEPFKELASNFLPLGSAPPLGHVSFKRSGRLTYPATAGWFRPVILLPPAFDLLSHAEQRAALLHEFEHIRRKDFVGNLAVELFTLPLSWHPAIAFLKARIRSSREFACDAGAASQMGAASYASSLVSAVRTFGSAPSGRQPRLAASLFGSGDLVARVRQVTSRQEEPTGATPLSMALCLILAGAALCLITLAPVFPCAPAAYHAAHYRNGVWHP